MELPGVEPARVARLGQELLRPVEVVRQPLFRLRRRAELRRGDAPGLRRRSISPVARDTITRRPPGPSTTLGRSALRAVAIMAYGILVIVGCGGDDETADDPVDAAQQRLSDAEDELAEAQSSLDEARAAFCEESRATSTASTATGT